MVDANRFVEVLTKMVYRECKKRGLCPDEDLVQDVLMRGWVALRRLYSQSKGVKWTTYVWYVIDSVLKDRRKELQKCKNVLLFDEVLGKSEDGELESDMFVKFEESFSEKLLRIVRWYNVNEDFVKLVIGDVDVSNALRSIKVSKKKGEEWIEWWLGRRLSEDERRCCGEIRALLREM